MKARFSLLIVLGILFGCENQKEIPSEPANNLESARYEKMISELNSQASNVFNNAKKINPITLTRLTDKSGLVKLEMEKISVSTGEYLIDNYYANLKKIDAQLIYDAQTQIPISGLANARTSEALVGSIIDTTSIFGTEQKSLIDPFITSITNLEDISQGRNMVFSFNQKVASSNLLSEEEKIELLNFSSLTSSLITFMSEDGISEIYNSMATELNSTNGRSNSNARVSGCRVETRQVWLGAVVGFFSGGAGGAYAGATAGTFTVPGIGTVTGAVAGGVIGAASGFVTGALGSVASELLGSCFRNIQSLDFMCSQAIERFLNKEITIQQIPRDCLTRIQIDLTGITIN